MKELRFDLSYTKDDAKKYVKLPFDMPSGIERIEVDYDYPRLVKEPVSAGVRVREANVIDLGIYDENGCLYGWSGSNQKSIFTSSTSSSPGYRHGVNNSGEWALCLGLYKIESQVTINVVLRIYPRVRKLYRGDMHIHTLNSDGSYPTAFVLSSSEKAGLDFIALTDHNNMKQNSEIGNPAISVIPGVEFTNYKGHANFFFSDPSIKFRGDFLANTFDDMAGLFRKAKDSGAVISINHPISDYPWGFGFENFPFDMIEVWNGPMRECNMKSILLWHEMLCQGKKISAIAGSDLHVNSLGITFGAPCTMVYSESPNPAEILLNLVAGRSCMAFAPQGPQLDLDIDGTGLGGSVAFRPGLTGKASLSSVREGDLLKVLDNEGVAATFTVPFNGIFTCSFPVEKRSFYRLELYRLLLDTQVLCGLSNPIFLQ